MLAWQLLWECLNINSPQFSIYESSGLIKKTLSIQKFQEYEVRKELVWIENDEDHAVEMESAYSTTDGSYVGNADFAKHLVDKYKMTKFQKTAPDHSVASIGFIKEYKGRPVWVGWSHRAMVPFGVGDKLFNEQEYSELGEDTLFTDGGKTTIETLDQAKLAASNFAKYVS